MSQKIFSRTTAGEIENFTPNLIYIYSKGCDHWTNSRAQGGIQTLT